MSEGTGIDKDALYGDFRAGQEAKQKLAMKAAHKALDIADDDMKIEANKTTVNGVGAKTLVGAVLAAGLPAAALAGLMLTKQAPAPAPPPAEKPAAVAQPAAPPAQRQTVVVQPGQAYDAIYEQQQPDGSWKEIRRERLK